MNAMKNDNKIQMRHELKYPLGRGEYEALRRRCELVMARDPHVGADGSYTIESLYFDDLADSALMANYAGVSFREKFRIRRYGGRNETLHLEKKLKSGGLGTKFSAPMTEAELKALLSGDTSWMLKREDSLIHELYVRMKTEQLRPKTIVAYRREPFVYGPGNVRVTFDYDIRSGICSTDLLGEAVLVPAMQNFVLMEVKWDSFLPDIIADIIQEDTLRVSAFSKYAACRQFDI